MKPPFFSIVIPTLNEEKWLPNLLRDLGKQTLREFEVLVADGKSKDKTVEKAKSFSKKFNLKVSINDKSNVSRQRNQGASEAKGEYVLFMDADTRLTTSFLDKLKVQIEKNPVDIFTCWCDADSDDAGDKAFATLINMFFVATDLLESPSAMGAMIGCRRDKFLSEAGFDPEVGFGEDTEMIRRYHKNGATFGLFREPKYVYSLRRFRKDGKLKTMQLNVNLYVKQIMQLKISQPEEYPMGGSLYWKDQKTQNIFDRIKSDLKKAFKRPTIMEKISDIFKLEE